MFREIKAMAVSECERNDWKEKLQNFQEHEDAPYLDLDNVYIRKYTNVKMY